MGSKFRFYLNRASVMSFSEIIYRIKWKLFVLTIQRFVNFNYKKNMSFTNESYSLDNFKKSRCGNFFFEHAAKNKVIKEYKKIFDIKKTRNLADKYCEHIIYLFEIKNKNLGEVIGWNKDYKSGRIWPQKYVSSFHHANTLYGDVRCVWELNRHSHLTAIAKAYYLTNNKKYAEEVLTQIESWIEQNPYLYTINWFSGLEIGVRLINWIWCLKFIKDYEGLTEKRYNKILKSIYLQADTIYHNLSLYSSANNHLTGEIAALKLISNVFPYFKDSIKWRKKSEELLKNGTIKQIYSDGVGAEQSTNYLLFILDLFIQIFFIAEKQIPEEYKSKIYNAGLFLSSLFESKNHLSDIGDSDCAHLIDFEYNRDKTESILNSLAIIFSDGNFKSLGKKIDEKTFWIFGLDGLKKYNKIKANDVVPSSKIFKEGGYLVSNSREVSLIFDFGSLGYLSTAGHGHCDALSFILSVNQKEFFIDPGTYIYHGDPEWRSYFRSTEAHNTVKIDGINQSELRGTFIYGRKAECKLMKSNISENKGIDQITAYHDGYKNIGVIPERSIVHDKNNKRIEIIDVIKTDGKHSHYISIYFNLHPKVKAKQTDNILFLDNKNTKVKLILDNKLNIKTYFGNVNPIHGWYSPEFGVKVPSICIEGKVIVKSDTKIRTIINY